MPTSTPRIPFPSLLCALLPVLACSGRHERATDGASATDGSAPADGLAPTGDPPPVEWHVGLGTDGEEHVHEGLQTSDGGFIGVGHTAERRGSKTDILVVKVAPDGQEQWTTRIGEDGQWDVGIAVLEVDGGYVVAGGRTIDGRQQSAIIKLDEEGSSVWSRTYHEDGAAAVRGLARLADGGLAATGYHGGSEPGFVFISDDGTGFLMVVDAEGRERWSVDIDPPQGTKIRQTPDGGFAVLSTVWVWEGGRDLQNAAIVKTDATGTTEWIRTYGGAENNQAFDFDMTPEGGFVLAGHTTGFGAANWDCLMMSVDGDGTLEWSTRLGQPRGYDPAFIHDECYGVRVDRDGGFVIAGGTGDEYDHSEDGHPSGRSDEWKGYLVKIDPAGSLVWAQVYGDAPGAGHNATEFLALTADGGYLLLNDTDSAGPAAPNNFGFMKLSPAGR